MISANGYEENTKKLQIRLLYNESSCIVIMMITLIFKDKIQILNFQKKA